VSASPPPVIRMPGSAGEPPHPYRPDVPNLFDWDQPEEESMLNNATLCGHLAVAALLMMNLGALASGGSLAAFGCLMAPVSWWMAQLHDIGAPGSRHNYLAIVIMQFFAAVTFLEGVL